MEGLPSHPIPVQRRFVFVVLALALASAVAAYLPVLNLPFAEDDFAHLKTVAEIWSGQTGIIRALSTPFNDQTSPVLRMFYVIATYLSGLDGAMTLRLMLIAVHSVSALLCGLLVYRYSASRVGMLVAAVAFSAAAGFSGSVISAPACAIFLLSLSFLVAAIYLLVASPLRGWSKFVCSLLALVIAGVSMNGAAVTAVTLAILVFWSGNESPKRRWFMAAIILATGVGVLLAAKWNARDIAITLKVDWNVVSKFAWIAYTAPLRFLCTWFPGLQNAMAGLIADNSKLVHVCAGGFLLICLSSIQLLGRQQRVVVLAALAGVLALTFLVAVGRAKSSYFGIYTTNRYYHFFLLPFAIQSGFVASWLFGPFDGMSRQRRIAACCLFVGVGVLAIFSSALNGWQWVHHDSYALHGRAISAGKELVRIIEKESRLRNPPRQITLLDGEIPFAGILKDTIALRTLWFIEYPRGIRNVVFQTGSLSDEDVAIENTVLNRWAKTQGRDTPPVRVFQDRIIPVLPWQVDFRQHGFDNVAVSGFQGWAAGSQWLGASGNLHLKPGSGDLILIGTVPKAVLNQLGRQAIGVRIFLNGVELGRAEFTGSREDRFRLPVPAELQNSIKNLKTVVVTFQPDITWVPRNLKLGWDERELSVNVFAVGFEAPPEATPAYTR